MVATESLIAVLGAVLGAGVLFEAGRRIGKAKAERAAVEADVADVEEQVDDKFNKLDDQIKGLERMRQKEHDAVISWLTRLTGALNEEGYDVEEPDAVRRTIDVHYEDDISPASDDD